MPRRPLLALLAAFTVALLAFACTDGGSHEGLDPTATQENVSAATATPAAGAMSLTSSAIIQKDNIPPAPKLIPRKYTCDGENISPPLSIHGVPESAISLALTVIDIDAPGGRFVHWTVWNIDPLTTAVPENTVPQGGGEGPTSRGSAGYFGPCPPSGTHRYVFTLYALDDNIVVIGDEPDTDQIEGFLEGHVLATAQLTGTYAR